MTSSIILSAVERYVRNVAEDIRELATQLNENGKRLLDLDEYSREQSKRVNVWHGATETAIQTISENVLAHDSVARDRQKNIETNFHQIENKVTDHCREWRSKEEERKKGKKTRDLSNGRISP